jgi:hypothetical protein
MITFATRNATMAAAETLSLFTEVLAWPESDPEWLRSRHIATATGATSLSSVPEAIVAMKP